jgi:hypothetical protein
MVIAITTGVLCIISFTIGAVIGQKVVRQEPIELPLPKIETFEERKARKQEIERNKIIAENIDNYDGTSLGQQRLPD